jgi:hypothetical protein
MLDGNLAMDAGKLEYISQFPGGGQLLLNLTRRDAPAVVSRLADRFGIREMLEDRSKDRAFMVSFLYYFGVLTIEGLTTTGEIGLTVPNLAMRKLYVERVHNMLLPDPADRDDGIMAAKKLYQKGTWPLCANSWRALLPGVPESRLPMGQRADREDGLPDPAVQRHPLRHGLRGRNRPRRADLTMIVRRTCAFAILDILIEFKFVAPKEAGLTGEEARKLTPVELRELPPVARAMAEAEAQVRDYGRALEVRHGNLRLRKYAVVSLGFERICRTEVRDQ